MDIEVVINGYSGQKKAHYSTCGEMLEERANLHYKHDAFVKSSERNSRTRAIIPQVCGIDGTNYRIPILVERRYRYKSEKYLTKLRNPSGTRMFAAERSMRQRAEDLATFTGRVAYAIDVSSFDGSQNELAQMERDMFQRQFKGSYDLKKVLKAQSKLRIRTPVVKVNLPPNRASGTGGTAVGNKIVMMSCLYFACGDAAKDGTVEFYCDGDDTLLMVQPWATHLVQGWLDTLTNHLDLGIKLEDGPCDPVNVVFCRSRVLTGASHDVLTKEPKDAIKTCLTVVRHIGPGLMPYLATLHVGFGVLWNGIPVLCSLHELYPPGKYRRDLLASSGLEYILERDVNFDEKLQDPTEEARRRFHEVTGISPSEQRELEHIFSSLTTDVDWRKFEQRLFDEV